MLKIVQTRPDVAASYPEAKNGSRDGLLAWARSSGAREMGYDPKLVRDDDSTLVGQRHNGFAATERGQNSPEGDVDLVAQPNGSGQHRTIAGVNVCGYLRDENGVGAIARGYLQALRVLGLPTALKDVSNLSPLRAEDIAPVAAFDSELLMI